MPLPQSSISGQRTLLLIQWFPKCDTQEQEEEMAAGLARKVLEVDSSFCVPVTIDFEDRMESHDGLYKGVLPALD